MRLWYDRPAASWQEGLPIGNGRLGAVVAAGADAETWHVAESTYWSGKPERTPSRSNGRADLERMRAPFFAGRYEEGERLVGELLQPAKGNFGTNLSLADVRLRFGHPEPERFARELSLGDAIARVSYTADGARHERETFASHADGVLVSRLRCDRLGGLTFRLELIGRTDAFAVRASDGDGRSADLAFEGRATENMHSDGACGVRCRGVVRIVAAGGAVSAKEGALAVEGADEACIYLAVATDYEAPDDGWTNEADRAVERAEAAGFETLRSRHVEDHRALFDRVSLQLGGGERDPLPTDERIRRLRRGEDGDPQLFALFYQYGRYLTIAGSREDSPLPLHLQGIWNDGEANRMAWSCDYHLDVNTEMNYYPAESGNLGECQMPLVRFVSRLAATGGRDAARDFYGCEGWVAHVFTNAWGFAAPGWHYSWGMNVTGGLWIASLLRERYEYGLDRAYLENGAYPVLKESARFFLDYMTVHPANGWLVTGPSNSPENSFYPSGGVGGGESRTLSMGPTMDQVLVRELFEFVLAAAETLDADEPLQARLRSAIAQLPPLQIGAKGQLQEWLEDYGEAQPDHRHMSHLYALYPGHAITPDGTPGLAAAARASLELRKRAEGLEDVEFTLALFASGYARLHDGDEALSHLKYLVGELTFDNLLTFSKPGIAGAEAYIFVADGNFGGTAAIAEMLVQGRPGQVELLPALPAQWATGHVDGLRLKGGLEAGIRWQDGELVEATLTAHVSGETKLRFRNRIVSLTYTAGERFVLDGELRPAATAECGS